VKDSKDSLWRLLWDYDPNGLLVVDLDMNIKVVNAAFCAMVQKTKADLLGKSAVGIIDDIEDFKKVWQDNKIVKAEEKDYPKYDLHVRRVLFPIRNENIIACIMVDVTDEWRQKKEIARMRKETIERVNHVVDKQMKVVQEIAGLLGETTAETKVSLLKLVEMLQEGNE